MPGKVQAGRVIFRYWDRATGLNEIQHTFSSLDHLFDLCLQTEDPLLVDRVIIEGHDADGEHRVVTLTFQSVTMAEDRS